jgi:hypothetical protein
LIAWEIVSPKRWPKRVSHWMISWVPWTKNESATTGIVMPELNLFLDSSALVAGVVSAQGASRALLLLAESGQLTVTISEQVLAESERAIARKAPRALSEFRQAILA